MPPTGGSSRRTPLPRQPRASAPRRRRSRDRPGRTPDPAWPGSRPAAGWLPAAEPPGSSRAAPRGQRMIDEREVADHWRPGSGPARRCDRGPWSCFRDSPIDVLRVRKPCSSLRGRRCSRSDRGTEGDSQQGALLDSATARSPPAPAASHPRVPAFPIRPRLRAARASRCPRRARPTGRAGTHAASSHAQAGSPIRATMQTRQQGLRSFASRSCSELRRTPHARHRGMRRRLCGELPTPLTRVGRPALERISR